MVLTREHGRVLQITINRPAKLNAINRAVALGLHEAVQRLESTPGLTVGVLHGAGRAFCAGNDLSVRVDDPGGRAITSRGFAGFTEIPPGKPVIAAVEGYAAGGGFEIALACDLIVAGDTAQFLLPEVRRGLTPGSGVLRLPRKLPRAIATEMMLTGAPQPAAALHHWGLVNRVVPAGQALEAALQLAGVIAANSPVSIAAVREMLDIATDVAFGDPAATAGPAGTADAVFFRRQWPVIERAVASPDAAEGVRAFLEKRAPVWPSLG